MRTKFATLKPHWLNCWICLQTQELKSKYKTWLGPGVPSSTSVLLGIRTVGSLKIQGGGAHNNVLSIIFTPLVEIGLTDLPKIWETIAPSPPTGSDSPALYIAQNRARGCAPTGTVEFISFCDLGRLLKICRKPTSSFAALLKINQVCSLFRGCFRLNFKLAPFYTENYFFHTNSKVIYSKYSKHWPYTVAQAIDCVCSIMLNHGFFLSLFKVIHTLPHILNCIFVSQSKFQIWILKLF